jgi:hypothetical protein
MTVQEEMANLTGGESKISASGFFNYVFNLDDDAKNNLYNMLQYLILAIIPVIIVLKLIKEYIPEEDEKKDTLEIIFEIIIQIGVLFTAISFIDKIIRYFPTYSGVVYQKLNDIAFILPLLIILFTMQTKLGAKVNIVYNRVIDMWNGNQQQYQVGNSYQGNVKVSQPIVTPGIHQVSRADTLDNTLLQPQMNQMPAQNNISLIDSLPNTMQNGMNDNMNSGSQMQNMAIQSAFMEQMEPMAANGALGGAFGSSF